MLKPSINGNPEPNVVSSAFSLTTVESSPRTEVVYTRWRPHVVYGMVVNSTTTGATFLCGEDDSGTIQYTSVGTMDQNDQYGISAGLGITTAAGNGWLGTIEFFENKYKITFTKQGTGLDLDFDFISIRGKNCHYETDQVTSGDSSGIVDYNTSFDPDVVFAMSSDASDDFGVGWGVRISPALTCGAAQARVTDDSVVWPFNTFGSVSGTSPYNGWSGRAIVGSSEFSIDWYKSASGSTVTVHMWALEYDECDADYYDGVPVDAPDIISGTGYTPMVSFRVGRWNAGANSGGIRTGSSEFCCSAWGWKSYTSWSTFIGKQGNQSSKRYDVNHTLSSGTVTEDVSLSGSPSGGASTGQRAVCFGAKCDTS